MTTEEILRTTDDRYLTLRCRLHRREYVSQPAEVAMDALVEARSARRLAHRFRMIASVSLRRDAEAAQSNAQSLYRFAFELFRSLKQEPALLRRDRYGRLPELRFERGLAAMKEAA